MKKMQNKPETPEKITSYLYRKNNRFGISKPGRVDFNFSYWPFK